MFSFGTTHTYKRAAPRLAASSFQYEERNHSEDME